MLRPMLWLAAAGICSGAVSAAEIHRCTGPSGEPAFSHRPCAAATTLSIPPPVRPAQPARGLRASERAWLADRERRSTPEPRRTSGAASAEGREDRQAYRCREKRRALEGVRAKLRRGYKPSQGERLRRRRRAYEDYLATFCS